MKKLVLLIFISALLFSCKNNSEKNEDKSPETEILSEGNDLRNTDQIENGNINTTSTPGRTKKDTISLDSTPNNRPTDNPTINTTIASGTYIRTNGGSTCNCNCLDIALNNTSELCLVPNEIYINARYEKVGNNIEVYYSGNSAKTTKKDLPWNKFDKTVPIAILTSNGNTSELDWKGFSMNGEVAVDYALLGKKNLEGSYKKQ
ncbi:hypothetical protein [Gramella sp. AN32]|uniref:Lipoprotein n=1 Tax=Christiangramia antarctica TaxID=2058158 RepID=A0ABW5X9K8_9FLAO|nr:hypothetical protein [Gramella sp. AN32]MCM4155898.1 hypothetical protein [Gramella sp. AN32]